jgi:hypothetical protein
MPAVASDNLSSLMYAPSCDSTASCWDASLAIIAREPGELISSSPLISTVSVPYSWKPICLSMVTACRITAMPCLSSAMPSPKALSPSMRNGCFTSMPLRYTVSMCAISITFFVPVPLKVALTILPIFSGVSSIR